MPREMTENPAYTAELQKREAALAQAPGSADFRIVLNIRADSRHELAKELCHAALSVMDGTLYKDWGSGFFRVHEPQNDKLSGGEKT